MNLPLWILRPLARDPTRLARWIIVINRLIPHRVWTAVTRLVLWLIPASWLRCFMASWSQPGACCAEGTVQQRFVERYFDFANTPKIHQLLESHLSRLPPGRVARLIGMFTRVSFFHLLHHAFLAQCRAHWGRPPTALVEVQLAPYSDCNLDCRGCYTRPERVAAGRGAEPSVKDLLRVADQAVACGANVIHVVGKGEPLLSEARAAHLLDVVRRRPFVFFTVATNGSTMTERLAAEIGSLANLLLLVSIDGPEPLHDERRGAGTYRAARRALSTLQRYRAMFGYACCVTRRNASALTSPAFVSELESLGCAIGVYSRYFPLAPEHHDELGLDRASLKSHETALAEARQRANIPLMDLDEVERNTGCRSRAGISVYIDATQGRVYPCLRMPFAPPACNLLENACLAQVLEHPFFVHYRRKPDDCVMWCGADPERELEQIGRELEAWGGHPEELQAYLRRWRATNMHPQRRLPDRCEKSSSLQVIS